MSKSSLIRSWSVAVVLVVMPVLFVEHLLADRESELRGIRAEIGKLESRLSRLEAREMTLQDQLSKVEIEVDLQRAKVTEAEAALEWATDRVTTAAAELETLTDRLERTRSDIARRVTGLYRLGAQGYVRLFLALDPEEELLPALRQLRFLVKRDQRDIEAFRQAQIDLEAQRLILENEQEEASRWRALQVERRDALKALERTQRRLLERARKEQRELAEQARDLREKARKLAHLIESLLSGAEGALDGVSIHGFRGVIDWPIKGDVVAEFGPRTDARYRTQVPHNGLAIKPSDEVADAGNATQVRSVYPGIVLFADRFEGYGLTVVIHHPGRVFTLYTGLEGLGVAKGDNVALGDVLGTASPDFYFEIREENQPVDPRGWLR